MSKKYIIELEEEVNGLCKAKGFNTLVFDQNGIRKLTPYEENEEKCHPFMFYYIDVDGGVLKQQWYENTWCYGLNEIGNIYKTKKEAQFVAERLKVIAELKEFAEPEDAVWDGHKNHWIMEYDTEFGRIEFVSSKYAKFATITFGSDADAKAAVDAVGKERLIKYYFGVK